MAKKQVNQLAPGIATNIVNQLGPGIATNVLDQLTYTSAEADARFAEKLFAVVDGDCTLVRGSGVTGVQRVTEGGYLVSFSRDLNQCAGAASAGGYALGPSSHTGHAIGQAHVLLPRATSGEFASQLEVLTTDSAGAGLGRTFQLVVC